MKKHAYLIIANRNFKQLQLLITLLDDVRNDIYILIDKKSNRKKISFVTKYSRVFQLPQMAIFWGDFSQIEAEIALFTQAAKHHYVYYHLLSGFDLPLANQNVIHDFFDKNPNKQFITYSVMSSQKDLRLRVKRHLFTQYFRIPKGKLRFKFLKVYRVLEKILLRISNDSDEKIEFGSNWVSLDDLFVQMLIEENNIAEISKKYRHGYLVDELFIPYEIKHLGFSDTVYFKKPVHDIKGEFQGNLRYINWWDGHPYIWRSENFDQLVDASDNGHFFARKFDMNIDSDIIYKIMNYIEKSKLHYLE